MTIVQEIAVALNVCLSVISPIQRWGALNERFSRVYIIKRWIIITAVVALILFIVSLVVVSLYQIIKRRKYIRRLIENYKKEHLNRIEDQILESVAIKADINKHAGKTAPVDDLDGDARTVLEENSVRQEKPQKESETSEQLETEVLSPAEPAEEADSRREVSPSMHVTNNVKRLSSRQIPVGQKIQITRRKALKLDYVEAVVTKNDDKELTVKSETPLKSMPGEIWQVRYYFGASVWKFDAAVADCNNNILVFSHSESVLLIDRRRFSRIALHKQAYVALFPFSKELVEKNGTPAGADSEKKQSDASDEKWGPPEFIPAVLTELSGLGLRIDVPSEVNEGDRVLIVFRLNEEDVHVSTLLDNDSKEVSSKIVEVMGVVKRAMAQEKGFSIAVELTGLADSSIDELIHFIDETFSETNGSLENVRVPAGDAHREEDILEKAEI